MQALSQTHPLHICSRHQGLMSDVNAYTLVQSQDVKPVSHKHPLSLDRQVWIRFCSVPAQPSGAYQHCMQGIGLGLLQHWTPPPLPGVQEGAKCVFV